MTEEQLNHVLEEMINTFKDDPRLIVKYLLFDLEATRRERDKLRMELEDKK